MRASPPPTHTHHPTGTYRGIIERLDYIQSLGVNAIELMPVHEFNELEYYQVGGWVGQPGAAAVATAVAGRVGQQQRRWLAGWGS